MSVTVLYLIDKLHRAGAQTNLAQLVRGLDRKRFRPLVVCLLREGPLADELRSEGVDVSNLGLDRIYGGRALRALGTLSREIREERVGVVHAYLVSANLFGAFASALAGVPALVTTRRDLGFSRNWRLSIAEQVFVNPRASRVVTPCEAVSEAARRELGLSSRKVVTVPNAVDLDFFRPREGLRNRSRDALGISSGARVVGVVANFLPVKGHEDFLRAATRLSMLEPEARYVLVGDGPLRPEMERLAVELGIGGKVRFTGARSDIRDLYPAFDVVVSPSRSEGLSNVVLEAMAMARPIVATAVGGSAEVLRHGETGLLVRPRDCTALTESMRGLLSDPTFAESLGDRARRDVEERFGVEKMVHRYMDLYDELLAIPSRTSS